MGYCGLILIRALMVIQFMRHVSAKNNEHYSTVYNVCRTLGISLFIAGYFLMLFMMDYSILNLRDLMFV